MKAGRKEGRKAGRQEGRQAGRNEGTNERANEVHECARGKMKMKETGMHRNGWDGA